MEYWHKNDKKSHSAVQNLPCLVTEELNHTLLQNDRFSWFMFEQRYEPYWAQELFLFILFIVF